MGMITRKLDQWLQAGLITPDQHTAILAFESDHPQHANWWIYSFMILGAAIIGLGVISLIAANWVDIPDSVKLGADFALLALIAGGIYAQYPNQQHGIWFEVLLVSFMLLCLSSIGLISQIFHTGGEWYHALLFWAVITFLLSLFASNLFTRFLWVTLFLHGVLWSIVVPIGVEFEHTWNELPAVLLLAPLLTAVLYQASVQVKTLQGFSSSLFFWFQLSAVVALVFADITHSGGDMENYQVARYIPAYIAGGILAGSIAMQRNYSLLNKVLLLAALALLLLYYHPDLLFSGESRYSLFSAYDHSDVSFWQADDIRAPLLTLAILFLYAVHAGNIGHQRTFNLVTFLIGLRFVILYFQAMGGLAATGIGLIVSGGLIMGIAWLWYKGREHLQQWTKGLKA
ncbi:MAG: DUF2157 domain-containing protein [Thiothrix sp.]|uniref:DUF2157 domain-containing protein n=1 Tax=Thiothrix sp. TaxID=1032 RepID=UPI002611E208|nr:DUF2157 domain-containing protein [Thiothrix sp.]MDD5394649.1 DUF2157 domain-containing protein [Thiothrix sp.]